MSRRITRSLALAIASLAALRGLPADARCALPYRDILAAGSFTGLLDCHDGAQVSAKKVGTIRTQHHAYTILDYRNEFKTAGGAIHGGQRILIIEDDKRYLGQYALAPPRQISVDGASVHINVRPDEGNEFQLSEKGVPDRVHLDGEIRELFR